MKYVHTSNDFILYSGRQHLAPFPPIKFPEIEIAILPFCLEGMSFS